jgi:hypothetical protein
LSEEFAIEETRQAWETTLSRLGPGDATVEVGGNQKTMGVDGMSIHGAGALETKCNSVLHGHFPANVLIFESVT